MCTDRMVKLIYSQSHFVNRANLHIARKIKQLFPEQSPTTSGVTVRPTVARCSSRQLIGPVVVFLRFMYRKQLYSRCLPSKICFSLNGSLKYICVPLILRFYVRTEVACPCERSQARNQDFMWIYVCVFFWGGGGGNGGKSGPNSQNYFFFFVTIF